MNVKFIFIISFLVSCLIQSGDLGTDTYRRLQVTHSLWTDAPPVPIGDHYGTVGVGGKIQPWTGIGQSLLMLPGDYLGTKLAHLLRFSGAKAEKLRSVVVVFVTFPFLTALIVLFAYRLLLALEYSKYEASLGSLILLFGTSLLEYTKYPQENSLQLFCTLAGFYYGYLSLSEEANQRRNAFISSLLLGFNLLVRLNTAIDLISVHLFLTFLLLYKRRKQNFVQYIKRCFQISLPIYLVFIFFERFYHWIKFGNFTGTYMSVIRQHRPDMFDGLNYFQGLVGPFFSLEKSVFIYDPLLILSVLGLVLFYKNIKRSTLFFALSCFLILFVYVPVYAQVPFWSGDWAWGDRYTTVPVQLICMLALPIWINRDQRTLFGFLSLSLFTQIASIFFSYRLEFYQMNALSNPIWIVGLRFKNIYDYFLGYTPICATDIQVCLSSFKPNFFPFLISEYLSESGVFVLKLLWWIGWCFVFFLFLGLSRVLNGRKFLGKIYPV